MIATLVLCINSSCWHITIVYQLFRASNINPLLFVECMDLVIWIGFIVALAALLIISKWSLWVAMFSASLILAFITLPRDPFTEVYKTLIDPGVLMLGLAVTIIPIIGGIMNRSGLMDSLVNNLRIGKRPFLMLSPALVGMLPMPGGALLSAPLIEKGGKDVSDVDKVAINVWFRHALYLVYPLSTSLIVGAKIAGLDIYEAILYLIPFFGLLLIVGYIFFVRKSGAKMEYTTIFSLTGLLIPMFVILIAPVLDVIMLNTWNPEYRESSLLVAVIISLLFAIWLGKMQFKGFRTIISNMRPWKYGLIVIGMFVFLNVFVASGTPQEISELSPSKVVLCVFVAFFLGLTTGRIQLPISIIAPIYLANFVVAAMEPMAFAITYFSIFLGYLISPVHPCNTVSLEYFKVSLKDFFKSIWPATGLMAGIVLVLAIILL